jgi:putative peptidoglycan lipid II flippase
LRLGATRAATGQLLDAGDLLSTTVFGKESSLQARIRTTSATLFLVTAGITATGYLRELVLASLFGAGAEMDAFYFSLALVLAVHDLVFVAALGAAIVPLLHVHNVDSAASLAERARIVVTATLVVAAFSGLLSILLWIGMPQIVDALAPRMSEPVRAMSTAFGTVLAWSLPAGALTTLFTLVLNAHHRFALAALAYLANNVIFLAVLLLFAPSLGARVLPLAAMAGPILTVLVLAMQLTRLGLLRRVRPDLSRPFFQPFWRLSRMLLLSFGIGSTGGLLMSSQLIIRSFAADYGEGAIAALGYAFRLYYVPLSLIASPAATLALPMVASLYAAGRLRDIGQICRQVFLWGLIILFPAAIIAWGGADLIVHVFLRRGNFDAEAARITAEALRGFAPAMMMEATFVVFFRVFYALRMPNRTVVVALVALASLIVLLLLVPRMAFIEVPLCLSAAFTVATCVLVTFLVRILGWEALPDREQLMRWLASATLGVAAWKLVSLYPADDDVGSQLRALTVFLGAYFLSVGVLLPDCRRAASLLMRGAVNRTGWWRR